MFIRRVNDYVERFKLGEDVSDSLHQMLTSWLINHIKRDDADYVGAVRVSMEQIVNDRKKSNDEGWFKVFLSKH